MLAIQALRAGGPDVLEAADLPVPTPAPGQVLVRHKAIGLNFIDTYQRSGLYPISYPATLGLEASGVVEAVGEGVTRVAPGDRVAYGNGPLGAYAEFHVVPAERLVKVPGSIDFPTAAAAMLKGMTAEFLLRRCRPTSAGDVIVVHAAAGGVGSILCQWGKALGATVIGTVGSDAKIAIAKANGCDHVLLQGDDWAAKVRELTDGLGADAIYDGVGAATFDGDIAALKRRGTVVVFGNASGPVPPVDPLRLSRGGSLYMTRPTLFDYIATTEELDAAAAAVFEVLASGKVKIEIGQTFPLAETRAAHEALEGRRTTGATVLLP
ncbi:MAG: quinone oxidoreductase [Caulobacterales bacterium]|nr:quinone oxidoreductase [Caulobacterales bacterium]